MRPDPGNPGVCHVINGLDVGGAELMLLKLGQAFVSRGLRQMVIAVRSGGVLRPEFEAAGIPVTSLRLDSFSEIFGGVSRLRAAVSSFAPTVLQGWMYHGNAAALIAQQLAPSRPRLYWGIRQSLEDHKYRRRPIVLAGAAASRVPTSIIYNSLLAAEQHERAGFASSRRVLIANGFDTNVFRPDPSARAEVRRSLGIPRSVPLVGLPARFHRVKRQDYFLRAVSTVAVASDAHFAMVGPGIDAGEASLRNLIAELELGGRVHLLGQRRDMARVLAAFDVVCLTSSAEGFPNVLGEAMSCGVPCVATEVGDVMRLVGGAGIVLPANASPSRFGEAIRELLEMPEPARIGLGLAARARIERCFSIDAIATEYMQIYGLADAGPTS
jgi:glycosyltransferase involved in cell wall biosynthesis